MDADGRGRRASTLDGGPTSATADADLIRRRPARDGLAVLGHKAADKLMDLIYRAHPYVRDRREPTEAEVKKATGPIKAFCTKKGLTFPGVVA